MASRSRRLRSRQRVHLPSDVRTTTPGLSLSEPTAPRHKDRVPTKHRVLKAVATSVAVVLVVVLTGGFFVYRHLNNNITGIDITSALGTDRPTAMAKKPGQANKPLNILLLGSDTREGQTGHIGGDTPGLSDTTILLHISADRQLAYGVSLPRDAMVERPECERKDGQGMAPAELSMFNAAYAVGGPACTIKTVEKLTDVRIDHFVVIDFNGFRKMVDALGGVEVCVPKEVNDTTGHITLPAGTYNVKGQQALDYVRVRHDISNNGDIGRMKRQQTFLASMANKAVSAGTAFTEDSPYRPRTPYNASKAGGDFVVRSYHETFGLAATTAGDRQQAQQWREQLDNYRKTRYFLALQFGAHAARARAAVSGSCGCMGAPAGG